MRFESNAERLYEHFGEAFGLAVEDTVEDARRRASVHDRSAKFSRSIRSSEVVATTDGLEATIGSPLSSARAKEKGAFIQAKRGPFLVFNAGSGVRKVASVRLAPQPAVAPAGRRFPEFMTRRLREARA